MPKSVRLFGLFVIAYGSLAAQTPKTAAATAAKLVVLHSTGLAAPLKLPPTASSHSALPANLVVRPADISVELLDTAAKATGHKKLVRLAPNAGLDVTLTPRAPWTSKAYVAAYCSVMFMPQGLSPNIVFDSSSACGPGVLSVDFAASKPGVYLLMYQVWGGGETYSASVNQASTVTLTTGLTRATRRFRLPWSSAQPGHSW